MDRFVWFVLLVVVSHLVTEFTRVTGYSRGPRQDAVTVNDSSIPPIKVQNLVLYPGQEYGMYELQNQPSFYNGNILYNNNNNNNNTVSYTNFLSSLFNRFMNKNQNGLEQSEPLNGSGSSSSNYNYFHLPTFRPIFDSIFAIPTSTLYAANNWLGRLTGGLLQPVQPQDPQQHQTLLLQKQPLKYSSYSAYQAAASSQPSESNAETVQPKL